MSEDDLTPFSLSHFSIIGAVRTCGTVGMLVHRKSLKHTLCFSNFITDPVLGFWSSVFVLSKVIELGEWQGFVSLVPSQLHPSSRLLSPILWRVPSPPQGS